MTDGASQGLYIVIAVIIFGIFVTISYMLFGDKLQTALGSIFSDSTEETQYNLKDEFNIKHVGEETKDSNGNLTGFAKLTGENSNSYVHYVKTSSTTVYIQEIVTKTEDSYSGGNSGGTLKGTLKLPDLIDGLKVLTISSWALQSAKITSVELPKYLTSIQDGLFNSVPTLTKIVDGIPEGVVTIGRNAFTNSPLTGSITLPKGLLSIGSDAFNTAVFTGTLTLPNSLKSIGSRAFINSKFSEIEDKSTGYSISGNTIGTNKLNPDGSIYFYTK